MEDLGVRIAELIERSGMTHGEFAERIGTSSATVSHILKGRNKPSLQVIMQIKSFFTNVNIDYILTGEGALFREVEQATPSADTPLAGLGPSSFPMEGVRKVNVSGVPFSPKVAEAGAESGQNTVDKPDDLVTERTESAIEKILVLYKDGHFRVYRP